MLSRISPRTMLSQPGRAAGRFLQTIQTEDARAADPRSVRFCHFRLDGPGAINDETGPNQGGDQRLPCLGLLVSKDNHEPSVRLQRSVTGTK